MSISPGRDDVAPDVDAAMASAAARSHELEAGTYGQGSTIGDVLALPPVPASFSKHVGGDDSGFAA